MDISLRNMSITHSEARKAIEDFFEHHKVCPKCNGKGYIDNKRVRENVNPSPMKLYISQENLLIDNIDKIEKFSEVVRDAIYRQKKMRKTCPKCKGEKFLELD